MAQYLPAPEGDASPGVAPGGLRGQYLRKASDRDYDTDWEDVVATGGGGGGVTSVTGTAPIASSGGTTPVISIDPATTSAAGSMSAADKTKLNAILGTNTGDQTITLTGDVTGSGTGSFAATLATLSPSPAGTYALATVTVDAKGRVTSAAAGTAPNQTGAVLFSNATLL